MRGRAHTVIGACAAVPVALLGGHLALPVCLAAGALGGLLPDLDHPGSTLGRYVPWPAVERQGRSGFVAHGRRWFHGHTVWHRGETHSVGAAGIAATVGGAAAWEGWRALGGWSTGQHLFLIAHVGAFAVGGLVAGAIAAGYLSHLAADTANPSPQMLLWPFSRRMVRPPWRGVREASTAGHLAEWAAATAAVAGAVVMWGGRAM